MRFWVELKDHVPNKQTVTSLLRCLTRNKLITNQCAVAKAWQPLQKEILGVCSYGDLFEQMFGTEFLTYCFDNDHGTKVDDSKKCEIFEYCHEY